MKKLLFGIFAHPDDEAFGPAASLLHAAQNNTDVHLILVTDGEAGNNPDNAANLGSLRLEEWKRSAKLIGAASQHALHYADGSLCNSLYLEISNKIITHIKNIIENYAEPVEIDFITYEHGGITGHLDHIAVSYITTYVFCKLRDDKLKSAVLGKLKYYCLPNCIAPNADTHWLYMQSGKADRDCDELFDYSSLLEKKLEIMSAHHSQRSDMKEVIKLQESTKNPCRYKDHFCYFKG